MCEKTCGTSPRLTRLSFSFSRSSVGFPQTSLVALSASFSSSSLTPVDPPPDDGDADDRDDDDDDDDALDRVADNHIERTSKEEAQTAPVVCETVSAELEQGSTKLEEVSPELKEDVKLEAGSTELEEVPLGPRNNFASKTSMAIIVLLSPLSPLPLECSSLTCLMFFPPFFG